MSQAHVASASRRCVVTGGAGFIGSHLVEALLARGDEVVAIDNESTGLAANVEDLRGNPRLEYVAGDAADRELLRKYLKGVNEVYHLAAAVGVALVARNSVRSIETNLRPTQNLLEELQTLAADGQATRLFFASTSEVYGKNPKERWTEEDDLVFGPTFRPRWSYGVSKALDEFLVLGARQEWGLPTVIGRFFNVVGPRQTGAYGMVLPRFVQAAIEGKPLLVHDDGEQTRCFAHVRDVVAAVLQLMARAEKLADEHLAEEPVFNIGSDEPWKIRTLAERVIALAESTSKIQFQSYSEAYDPKFEDIRRRVPDLTKLRKAIDYRPQHNLDAIIRETIAWHRE
jgi:UDP-glucose 4-epimerase